MTKTFKNDVLQTTVYSAGTNGIAAVVSLRGREHDCTVQELRQMKEVLELAIEHMDATEEELRLRLAREGAKRVESARAWRARQDEVPVPMRVSTAVCTCTNGCKNTWCDKL